MSALWVDTDFGFDDLWALLLLRRSGAEIAGISLVAGNAPLPQVIANAQGAARAYGLDTPMWRGADRPLSRAPETALRVLGSRGMPSRGRHLPDAADHAVRPDAVAALRDWLLGAPDGAPRELLAIGPLTNIATLVQQAPDAAAKITRLVWMGGSDGPGNHSAAAEFNALADPEAAAIVAGAGLALDVIDLMLCRKVTFGPADMPATDPLTADLLGGYLDIGVTRGRPGMSIYDPVAALAMVDPQSFEFDHRKMDVSTSPDESYGATRFTNLVTGKTRLAVGLRSDIARRCLDVLARKDHDGN